MPGSDPEGLVCVGAIAGAFGVRGEARIKSFCAQPAEIARYSPLQSEDGRAFELRITRPLKGGFAARLSGVETREQAEACAAPGSTRRASGCPSWPRTNTIMPT